MANQYPSNWNQWLRETGIGEYNPEVEQYARPRGLSYEMGAWQLHQQRQATPAPTPAPGTGAVAGLPAPAQPLAAGQETREEDFLKRLRETMGAQPSLTDISTRLETELGLPGQREVSVGLRSAVVDLEQSLSGMPGRVAGETRGFDVTAAQLARIQEARGEPVREDLIETARAAEKAGIRLGAGETELGRRLGLEAAGLERELQPFATEAGMMSDRAAREITLYSTERQAELSELLQKLQTQGQLSVVEAQSLNKLALQEDEYQKVKEASGFGTGKEETQFATDEAIRQALALRKGGDGGDIGSAIDEELRRLTELTPVSAMGIPGGINPLTQQSVMY